MGSHGFCTRTRHITCAVLCIALAMSFRTPAHSAVGSAPIVTGVSVGRNLVVTQHTPARGMRSVRLRFARSVTSKIAVSPVIEASFQAVFLASAQAVHVEVIQKGATLARIDAHANEQGIAVGVAEIPSHRLSRTEPIQFKVSFSGDSFEAHDQVDITGTLRAAVLPA